jgi:hypothetical protein
MDIIINYWAVLGAGVFLMAMGMIWYGPLFGKTWMNIMGVKSMSKEEIAKAQKEMMPYYALQLLLAFVTSFVLYYFVKLIPNRTGIDVAFWIWVGFAMPMAAGAMWDTQNGMKLKKFMIIAGYQLVTLLVLGWAFTMW